MLSVEKGKVTVNMFHANSEFGLNEMHVGHAFLFKALGCIGDNRTVGTAAMNSDFFVIVSLTVIKDFLGLIDFQKYEHYFGFGILTVAVEPLL